MLGGTGVRADWKVLSSMRAMPPGRSCPPLILAGGLTPDNVAEAIQAVNPAGVDVSSGVEHEPGKKNPHAIAAFVRAARAAAR